MSLVAVAQSVIESPGATITLDLAGANTCKSDTKKYFLVRKSAPGWVVLGKYPTGSASAPYD
jgi:hypothetical protein